MRARNRLLLIALLALALLLFSIASAPFTVANAVRVWLWWNARQQGLAVSTDYINAPLFHPVVVRGLRVTSSRNAVARLDANVAEATVGLNVRGFLLHRKMRAIRAITLDGFHLSVHQGIESGQLVNQAGWRALHNLLPDAFNIQHGEVRVEDRDTVVLLRNVSFSGSEIEAGTFQADQVMIASPWLRQTFGQLRGGTKWQENRLTIAGLSLTTGVDLASVTFDLSELGDRAIGIHFDAEVFGGEIRADISHDWRSAGAISNVAGSASEISLAQLAAAIGFTDHIRGLLHACKFSLRGNLLDPLHATGWMWTELTHLQWHDRALDLAMFGAAFNHRQVAVEQLYLKQSGNELTLTGEATLPPRLQDWMKLNLRADIAASIRNLANLALLCGAKPTAFGGELSVAGSLKAHDRKFDGQLHVEGSGLTISNAAVDLLRARVNLSGTQLGLEQLDLARGGDFLHAEGKIDISPEHAAQGSLVFSVANLTDYFPHGLPASGVSAQLSFQGHAAAIDSLTLRSGSARVDFTGTTNFADLRKIGATITPEQPLFESGALATAECISGLQLLPLGTGAQSPPQIQTIALQGSIFTGDWQLILKKDAGPDEFTRICRESMGRRLEVMVGSEKNREFGANVLQAFRTGDRKPLSLSLDQR